MGGHARPRAVPGRRAGRQADAARALGDAEEIVGTAASQEGARVVAARAGDAGRIVFLTRNGPDDYRTQPAAATRFVRLVAAGAEPVLVAGAPGAERLFALRPLPRGESRRPVAFAWSRRTRAAPRATPLPLTQAAPPDVTTVAASASP